MLTFANRRPFHTPAGHDTPYLSPVIMLRLFATAVLCLLAAAALPAPASSSSSSSCAAVTSRAPCGQQSDSEERCLSKGCCFDPAGDGKVPCYFGTGNAVPITDVHIIQASHFDAGFAYTIKDVLQLWWYSHFPRAFAIGSAIAANASLADHLGLHFTAQCWLLDLFFNCPPDVPGGLRCPTDAEKAAVQQSVRSGWLSWHAFPFNSEYELHGAGMLAAGVARCHALDDMFGLPRKATASQRDVPGTTRSAIPALLAAGVTSFSNGVNGASTPPFVPRAFMWRDAVSGLSLPTMIHPYGYGGTSFEDAVIVPGLAHAMVFAWRGDNAGPPDSVSEIEGDFSYVQSQFPGAKVHFSNFDDFTAHLLDPAVLAQLPVVTAELGDTWVHGAGSDPVRLAFFRRAGALRSMCVERGECSENDPVVQNFTRLVLKCGEHTWGKDIKSFLHDTNHWANAELQAQLAAGASNFLDVLASWQEQRAWCIDYPIAALAQAGHPLGDQLRYALDDLRPSAPPSTAGFAPFAAGTVYNAGRWSIGFDAATGAISTLVDALTGATWASPADGSLLGVGHYVSLSQADYAAFTGPEPAGYYPQPGASPSWFQLDFGKPNCSEGGAAHNEAPATGGGAWLLETENFAEFLVASSFGAGLHANFGAPQQMWTRISVPRGVAPDETASIALTYEIFGKTPTRLPEGLFLRFNASAAGGPLQWRVVSLGGAVDPFDVVPGGNQHLHGFAGDRSNDAGVRVTRAAGQALFITSDSAALAAFGRPTPLPAPVFPNSTDPSEGMAFMLEGNTWGTNYPAWFPFDAADSALRWRFDLTAE